MSVHECRRVWERNRLAEPLLLSAKEIDAPLFFEVVWPLTPTEGRGNT